MSEPAEASTVVPQSIRWSGVTDPGRFRSNNEDAFLALNFDGDEVHYLGKEGSGTLEAEDFVFAVSDGMGGAKSGEVASRIAVDKITRLLPSSFVAGAARLERDFSNILAELFERSHRSLLDLSMHYEECRGMGATLSLCWFMPGWMAFGHVGDSRIYYLPPEGGMKQVTRDHTLAGRLFRCGTINEREARDHPQKNMLEQVLGGRGQDIEPHIGRVACQPGDRFVICSDGLVDGLWNRRLEELARTRFSAQALVDYAVGESGRDNTTAVMVEVF